MSPDPYRYFRIEAQELLEALSAGLLTLEGAAPAARDEALRALLRHAHTLKGAARVVREMEMGDLAHRLEDELAPWRDHTSGVPREAIDAAMKLVAAMGQRMPRLGQPAPPESEPAVPPTVEEPTGSVRVPLPELDALLTGLQAALAASGRVPEAARTGGARGLRQATEEVAAHLSALRLQISELRLAPAQGLVTELRQVVRDTCQAAGRQAELRVSGAEVRLDAAVLAALRGALQHVVRNAVVHGIEAPATRTARGKPPVGSVEVAFVARGHRVTITCRDDGSGLDLAEMRRVAVQRGHLGPDEAARTGPLDLLARLASGGFSTAALSPVAGRGVGLDAVREAITGLRGELALHTEPGRGTTVEMVVPVTLSGLPTLALYCGGEPFLLPLDAVRCTARFAPEALVAGAQGAHLQVDDEPLPYAPLAALLGRPVGGERAAVVVRAGGRCAALGVERIGGVRSEVVQDLPPYTPADPMVAGAALDDTGRPRLVLAPHTLIDLAQVRRPTSAPPPPPRRLPVLVVDDSVTTRMLEKSILESAGFEVEVAASGEEGLRVARAGRHLVYLVDVEMPGMNGFEFIATTRADPDLRGTPAILVTSRDAPEDRRRGAEAGARAYLIKSEFEQRRLLEIIQGLEAGS